MRPTYTTKTYADHVYSGWDFDKNALCVCCGNPRSSNDQLNKIAERAHAESLSQMKEATHPMVST